MSAPLVIALAAAYLYLLFAVAYAIDKRARRAGGGASRTEWMYALSIAVYCTSWTFYGSVGRSANTGIGFLPIYIGPILVFTLGQPLLRKILRIAKTQHSTTIADFISARYGKNQAVAGLVTVIAVVGIMPYISLQLKAVSSTFEIISRYPATAAVQGTSPPPIYADTALYVALLMGLFVIAFGTRRVDATEQHRGMVGAVALESVVKLAAFLCVGAYVVWWLFDGPQDLFARAAQSARGAPLLDVGAELGGGRFWALTVLAMAAIICLPRQFQVTVVENTREQHLQRASWIFPLYLVAINLFVLPIALAGLLTLPQGSSADSFVLTLPIAGNQPALAMFAFVGGLSAATGMMIVETIALSTMICNDLVMPLAIRRPRMLGDGDLAGRVKAIRRVAIVGVLLLGYAYVRLVGDSYALVSIGLVSFAAAAQFAPAMILGLYWKQGNRKGALAGLSAGVTVWAYTLLLPSLAQSGWLPANFVHEGPLSIAWLKPYALFGVSGLDEISHSLLFSMLANVGAYVLVSRRTEPDVVDRIQAQAFVDVFVQRATGLTRTWAANVTVGDLRALVGRFVDADRVQRACAEYASSRNVALDPTQRADSEFVDFAERLLAGAIGSALSRVVMASAIQERQVSLAGVVELLSDASQAIRTSWDRLREAIENVSQGISMYDGELRLVVWNRRVLELMGLPAQFGAVGMRFEDIMRYNAERGEYGPGDIDRIVAEKLELVKRPYVIERERPDGLVLELRGKPLPGGGFVSTVTDITERKRAELALRHAHDELEQRVQERTQELLRAQTELMRTERLAALGSLVAGVAHEINTPVGIGLTAATYLEEQVRVFERAYVSGQLKRSEVDTLLRAATEASGSITANLQRAAELVRSFKLVAVDQSSEHKRVFNLKAYIDEILRSLQPRLRRTRNSIDVDCPQDIELDSYPGAFSQVLTNLVMNSLTHGFDEGTAGHIAIAVSATPRTLVFVYRDDGRGMSEEHARRMFEPFFTTRRGQGGSGLGLHVVYNVVTQTLGGRIEGSSAPGQGVLFRIEVPYERQEVSYAGAA